ncbi:hypothetical protein M0638_11770, partial [Roseomonas sp. NAR14]|nr:hypothetical protein [Roseomonas acroporae]
MPTFAATFTYRVNVKGVTLPLSGDPTSWPSAVGNTVTGTSGNDQIWTPGSGATLTGGAGDDTYYVTGGETVVEAANGGIDTVYTYARFNIMPENVENMALSPWSAYVKGNALNNLIAGNDGNQVINGGIGNDVLTGGAGSDTF